MRIVLVSLLASCLPSCAPCQPEPLDDVPDAPPGAVRRGVALSAPDDQRGEFSATTTARGVACVACDGVFYFDASLRMRSRIFIPFDGRAGKAMIATSGDLTIVLDRAIAPPRGGKYEQPRVTLFALSATGREQWRVDEDVSGVDAIIAWPTMTAGPASVVYVGAGGASVLDPATGTPRWRTAASRVVVPDPAGGLLVGGSRTVTEGRAQLRFRHLDATGAQDWAAIWTGGPTGSSDDAGIASRAAAATPDGGFVLAVAVDGPTLDLGDRVLQGSSAQHNEFVVVLDKDGAVQWTQAIGDGVITQHIAPIADGVLIAGLGGSAELGLASAANHIGEGFLARVRREGDIAAHAFVGISGLFAEADGSATVLADNDGTPRPVSPPFGDRDSRYYLLNIMP